MGNCGLVAVGMKMSAMDFVPLSAVAAWWFSCSRICRFVMAVWASGDREPEVSWFGRVGGAFGFAVGGTLTLPAGLEPAVPLGLIHTGLAVVLPMVSIILLTATIFGLVVNHMGLAVVGSNGSAAASFSTRGWE